MIQTIIGAPAFRRGMDLYVERHDNQAVTIEDFVAAMQDASGVDLDHFKLWYSTPGTPEVTVSDSYDPAARRYTLTLHQTLPKRPGGPPLLIPVAMGLLAPGGEPLPTRLAHETAASSGTRVLAFDKAEQSFTFVDVPARPVPSLLRGFSAPVKLSGATPAQLRFLATHDTDPFVRWASGQHYAARALLAMVDAHAAGAPIPLDPGVIEAAAATLAGSDADPEFAAMALALPGEGFLGDQMAVVDVDGIHAMREAARHAFGRALAAPLREAYDRLAARDETGIDTGAMGRRALKNTCLAALAAADAAAGAALAWAQFIADRTMTDVLAALAVLTHTDCPEREAALAAFHARWRHDALVLDKWFALQASATLPGTLAAVQALARHPDFEAGNPNRVRALVGSFAYNRAQFHAASGAGYAFLADTVLALDPRNSQTAARMVTPLGAWRRYDEPRQVLMQAELQRIQQAPGLSRGTYEMVSRSLG